uniref:Secreted protein n=1 Tax=Arundo donax TaxID=35708 RepID=A0A0A9HYG5_ARUDO
MHQFLSLIKLKLPVLLCSSVLKCLEALWTSSCSSAIQSISREGLLDLLLLDLRRPGTPSPLRRMAGRRVQRKTNRRRRPPDGANQLRSERARGCSARRLNMH